MFITLIIFIVLGLVQYIYGNGIVYDPFHSGYISYSKIMKDLKHIRQHYSVVRVHQAVAGNLNMGMLIHQAGLKATIGIDPSQNLNKQIDAVLYAVKKNKNFIHAIFVGNENLTSINARNIINIIQLLKKYIKKMNNKKNIPIGTVQEPYRFYDHNILNLNELINECDVLGANIYPYFTPLHITKRRAIDELLYQWKIFKQKFPHKKIMLTETGWPSKGKKINIFRNIASFDKQKEYFNDYNKKWFKKGMPGYLHENDMYFFQFFNTPYKVNQNKEHPVEEHFGLINSNGKSKYPKHLIHGIRRNNKNKQKKHR